MPATSVMTSEQTKAARHRPAPEAHRHRVPARPPQPADPAAAGPALALVTTGAHTGCPLVTAEELGVRVVGSVHCGAGPQEAGADGPTFAEAVEAFAQADGVGAIAACVDAIGGE
ncbi:MAG: hypothetical protein HOV87_30595, partial [Catenulispora sp.]|nr:hypothetical protein [Catenulispora sp.]